MVAIIGGARPDCDWADKGSKRGCREQAVFRVGLKGPQGQFTKHTLHGCRTHAPDFVKMVLVPLRRTFMEQGQPCIITIIDLALEFRAAMKLVDRPVINSK